MLAMLGLALYLWILAMLGKSLKQKNTTLRRRRVYGSLAGAPMFIGLVMLPYSTGEVPVIIVVLTFVWDTTLAVLCYVTVAHTPRWIVGNS